MSSKPLSIFMIASETTPYAKTGGLADVIQSLSKELVRKGHNVSLVLPYYGFVRQQNVAKGVYKERMYIDVGKKEYPCRIKYTQPYKGLTVFFIGNEEFFGRYSFRNTNERRDNMRLYNTDHDNLRFLFFTLAAKELLRELAKEEKTFDVVHAHDWQGGLLPNALRTSKDPYLRHMPVLYTLHNLSYQMGGAWWKIPPAKRDRGSNGIPQEMRRIPYINFMKRGIIQADVLNTVSERYAQEILLPEFGQKLENTLQKRKKDLYGIINGIDYSVHNPMFDKNIAQKFDWNSLNKKLRNKRALQRRVGFTVANDIPLIGMVNRLVEQKGLHLVKETIELLLRQRLQMIILGEGEKEFRDYFRGIQKKYPKKFALLTPFTHERESRINAGSDMFLMPSRYEPCGISQLKSLRYGSVPIVHETGGLSDTVTNFNPKTGRGNGFVFPAYTREYFLVAVTRALETYKYPAVWVHLVWKGMQQSFSWELPAKKYVALYRKAIKKRKSHNS